MLLFAALFIVILAGASATCDVQGDLRDWQRERVRMVNEQLKARDIRDERVLSAMLSVPRHLFIPESVRDGAYTGTSRCRSVTDRRSLNPTSLARS